MNARKYIGGFLAIIGLTTLVSVAEGSAFEDAIRCAGIALMFIGLWIATRFNLKHKEA